MQVKVRYLGMLKELTGREEELVYVADGALVGDLYAALQQRIPQLQQFRHSIALAVNYEYSGSETPLHDGDEVALIPPVSGGAPDESISSETTAMQATEHAALGRAPITGAAIPTRLKQPDDGAVVVFDGIVRNQTRGRRTLYLDYTAYEPMALRQMEQLAQQALANPAIRDVWLVHRL